MIPLNTVGRSALLALAAAWPVAAASLHAGDRPWRLLETPRFTVVSQLKDQPTRAWAEEFNQFIEELRRTFRAERSHLPPLTVVLFARERDFNDYKPLRSDGRGPAPVAGFFHHRGNWSVIGLAEGFTDQSTRELIFHEGVHWFTSNDPVIYPLWLSEGLAEVFSTFRQEGGSVRWGTDITSHVRLLRTQDAVPLDRLLFIGRDHPLFDETNRTGIFYASAWVFTHYLMFGERVGPRDAISDYLDLLGTEIHPDEAFRQAFGQGYEEMGNTLATYIRDGHYYKVSRPEAPGARVTAGVQGAPPAEVTIALARLAMAGGRPELARTHAQQAVAESPDDPRGHELLALLYHDAGDVALAHAESARAVELGSRDASTLFLLAFLTAREQTDRGGITGPVARRIGNLYRDALEESPTLAEAYANLAALAPTLEPLESDDINVLKQGARIYTNRGDIVFGLAQMIARRGDRATARDLIAEARLRGLPLETDGQARRLEETWAYDEAVARIERLSRDGDNAGALAACDAAIVAITDIHVRGSLLRTRQALFTRKQLAAAEAAARFGNLAEACALYEALLEDPGTPVGTRTHIVTVLERLRAAAAR